MSINWKRTRIDTYLLEVQNVCTHKPHSSCHATPHANAEAHASPRPISSDLGTMPTADTHALPPTETTEREVGTWGWNPANATLSSTVSASQTPALRPPPPPWPGPKPTRPRHERKRNHTSVPHLGPNPHHHAHDAADAVDVGPTRQRGRRLSTEHGFGRCRRLGIGIPRVGARTAHVRLTRAPR